MNLVDILAEELTEWPQWADYITQSCLGNLFYRSCDGCVLYYYIDHHNRIPLKKATIANDWASAVVREVDWLKAGGGKKKADDYAASNNQVGYVIIVYSREGARTDGSIYETYEQAQANAKGNVIAIAEVQWEEK